MTSSQNNDVRVGRKSGSLDPLRDCLNHNLFGIREPVRVSELLAVIEDMDLEADRRSCMCKMIGDVTRPDQVQMRCRFDRLDVYLHLPSADQSRLLRYVVSEFVACDQRFASVKCRASLPECIVLVAPTAYCTHGLSVGEHEHLCAHALRGRALRSDNRHQRHWFAALQRVTDRFEDIFVHRQR